MSALGIVLLVVWLLNADAALAHDPAAGIGSFYGGMLHALLTPAHLMSLIGLGLLLNQQDEARRRIPLVLFGVFVVAGLAAGACGLTAPAAGSLILAIAALAGILVAGAFPLPVLVIAPLVGLAGSALGLDSTAPWETVHDSLPTLTGQAAGAFLLLTFFADFPLDPRWQWQHTAVRVVGSWTAASAVLVLALVLAKMPM